MSISKFRVICGLISTAVAICGMLCVNSIGKAETPAHTDIHHGGKTTTAINPHLHVPPAPKVSPSPLQPHTPKQPQTRTPHWDANEYITRHRALTTIRGQVMHKGNGQPVSNVHVALRRPGGRVFANVAMRHVTYTSANGGFIMTNVRPGTYRVFAFINRKKSFVRVAVHSGSTDTVAIKI